MKQRHRPRKIGFLEALGFLRREVKRKMIADGLIQNPATREPRVTWQWRYEDKEGTVKSDTRSQAKALVKKLIGIGSHRRLPNTVELTPIN